MPKKDDVEEKVAWYQTLTPTLQKQMISSIEKGVRVIEERMGKLLNAFKKDGGFKNTIEAHKWLKTHDPQNVQDLYKQLESVTDPVAKQKLAKQIDMENHRFAYTREKYLRDTIRIQNQRMAEDMRTRGSGTVENVAKMGYLYKNYEISKKSRVGFSVGGFPEGLLRSAVTGSLDATKTIGYFDTVSQGMKDELIKGITSGQSTEQIAQNVHTKMQDRELWVSRAFARTSICEVSAQAEKTCMEEAGIKKYTYRCTLDETTCPVCGSLDGRNFLVADAKAGVNYPPMHRNCRCTEVPFITKTASEGLKRRARDEKGKSITVDRNMTYREWAEKYAPKSAQKLPPIKPMEGEQFHREAKPPEPPKEKPKRDKFTQKEKDAVEYYVSGEGMFINQYLRNGTPLTEQDKRYVAYMDKAISKAKVSEEVLYRSVDAQAIFGKMTDAEYDKLVGKVVYGNWDVPKKDIPGLEKKFGNIEGKTITEKGFMSTTKDKEFAKEYRDWSGSNKPVVLRFTNAKGKNGFPVDKYFEKKGAEQQEVLLGRGMNYKVNKVYAEDGEIFVDCEFVDEVEPVTEIAKEEKKPALGTMAFSTYNEFSKKTVAIPENHVEGILKVAKENAPDELIELWNECQDDMHISSIKNGQAHCMANTVEFNIELESTEHRATIDGKEVVMNTPYSVVFHEYGHAMDFVLSDRKNPNHNWHKTKTSTISNTYRSSEFVHKTTGKGYTLAEMVKQEVDDELEGIANDLTEKWKRGEYKFSPINGKKFTKQEVYSEFSRRIRENEDMSELVDYSDMLQGATNFGITLCTGHNGNYWKGDVGHLGTEVFAEMTSATMSNHTSLKGIKRHLPKAYKIYQEIVRTKGVSKNGYTK